MLNLRFQDIFCFWWPSAPFPFTIATQVLDWRNFSVHLNTAEKSKGTTAGLKNLELFQAWEFPKLRTIPKLLQSQGPSAPVPHWRREVFAGLHRDPCDDQIWFVLNYQGTIQAQVIR